MNFSRPFPFMKKPAGIFDPKKAMSFSFSHFNLLVVYLLLGGLSCSAAKKDSAQELSHQVGEASVTKGSISRQVVVDGSLYSPSSLPITVQRVRWYWEYNILWTAEEGSWVHAEDVVIKLDPATIQKDLDEKKSALEEAKLTLEEETIRASDEVADAKNAITTAEFDLKKEKLLLTDSDAVAEAEKQKQRLKIAAAEANLRRAKEKVLATKERTERRIEMQSLKVKQAMDEVAEMERGLAKTELKAPQDGLLIFPLYSSNGGSWQKARQGGSAPVNAQIAEIANTKDLVAKLYIPEVDAHGVLVDTPGDVMLSIAPGKTFTGKVKSIAKIPTTPAEREGSKSAKPADNIRQIEVLFELSSLPENAMPGMTVRAVLTPIQESDVLIVPTEALVETPGDQNKPPTPFGGGNPESQDQEAFLFLKTKGSKDFRWQKVPLGVESVTHAQILSGANEGDTIAIFAW